MFELIKKDKKTNARVGKIKTSANYYVNNVSEVQEFFRWLYTKLKYLES